MDELKTKYVKRKPQNFWTADEIELLTDLYATTPTEEIVRQLCRSYGSVLGKAYGLGLQSKNNLKVKGTGKSKNRIKSCREWSEFDTNLLIELFPDTSNKIIAERLGKTAPQIVNKAWYMKLRKSATYQPKRGRSIHRSVEDVEKVKKLYPVTANKKIRAELGCSDNFIYKVAKSFGLKKNPFVLKATRNQLRVYKTGGIVRRHGYLRIYCGQGRYEKLHFHNWKKHHGTVPPKHVVTFKDGNRDNCDISNLEAITFSESHRRRKESHLPVNLRPLFRFTSGLKRIVEKAVKKTNSNLNGRFWTPEKIQKLNEMFGKISKQEIAEMLGCVSRTVYDQAAKLGLYEKRPKKRRIIKTDNSNVVRRNRISCFWTDAQIQFLKESYITKTNPEMAQILGVSVYNVQHKLKKLNLRKSDSPQFVRQSSPKLPRRHRFWNEENTEFLRQNYSIYAGEKLAEALGVSVNTIRQKAKRLGITKGFTPSVVLRSNGKFVVKGRYFSTSSEIYKRICELNNLTGRESDLSIQKGYLYLHNREQESRIKLHNYLWIKQHGEIPEKNIIVFKDGDTLNCRLENLEMITLSEFKWRKQIASYPEHIQPAVIALVELKKAIQVAPKVSTRYLNGKTHAIWSNEELAFLKANYAQLNNAQLATELKRHPDAIATMKTRLGLRVVNNGGRRKKGAEVWTSERVERLKEIYPLRLAREIAEEFGCSDATVVVKAKQLGISKGRGNKPVSHLKANLQAQASI